MDGGQLSGKFTVKRDMCTTTVGGGYSKRSTSWRSGRRIVRCIADGLTT